MDSIIRAEQIAHDNEAGLISEHKCYQMHRPMNQNIPKQLSFIMQIIPSDHQLA